MDKIELIYTDKIKLPPNNMREHIDRDALYELAADIKQNGLISPITVRPKDGEFELVAGQRRYMAHQIAGLIQIRCIVKNLTDDEAFAIMTSENLERVDVNPVDESKHVARLVERAQGDIKEVSRITRRSEKWVRDRLAIGEMPDYMQELLAAKKISQGVALELVQITDDDIRRLWCEMAARDGISVDQANFWVHGWRMNNLPGAVKSETPPDGYEPSASEPVKFECSLSGERYDARVMRSVMISEEYLPVYYAFAKQWREQPVE